MKDYSKLSGEDWSWLLREQPELAKHVDWSKLGGKDWSLLLIDQPQFAKHVDWSKLNGADWSWLLIYQPKFAKHVDWSKLDGKDWRWLLLDRPELEKYKPKNMSEASTMPKMSLLRELMENTTDVLSIDTTKFGEVDVDLGPHKEAHGANNIKLVKPIMKEIQGSTKLSADEAKSLYWEVINALRSDPR